MTRHIALLGLLALSGCAEWAAAASSVVTASSGQVSNVQTVVQQSHDVEAKTWAALACGISYGELVRNGSGNPNLAEAVIMLCGAPSGFTMIHNSFIPTATTTIPTSIVKLPATTP